DHGFTLVLLPFNTGRPAKDGFTLVEHYKEGSDRELDAVVLTHRHERTTAEVAANLQVPAEAGAPAPYEEIQSLNGWELAAVTFIGTVLGMTTMLLAADLMAVTVTVVTIAGPAPYDMLPSEMGARAKELAPEIFVASDVGLASSTL